MFGRRPPVSHLLGDGQSVNDALELFANERRKGRAGRADAPNFTVQRSS
jgi:hypothetical protein